MEKRFSGVAQIDPSNLDFPRGGNTIATGVYNNIHNCCERRCQQSGKPKGEGYMAKKLQAIRGMNDILPSQTPAWQTLENILRQLTQSFAYQEIRFPILENTALFKRSIGEVTDIVSKEMYTFEDRNGDSITIRPEGTAGCVRAGIEHGLLYNQVQRLWYMGPMFRHEKPQQGRYRQFYQFGLEAFGLAGPDIDVEQILFSRKLWNILNISNKVTLQINNIGTKAERDRYRTELVNYFSQHFDVLDEDSKKRLEINPLRILDSKNPNLTALIAGAPNLHDYLDQKSLDHFAGLKNLLDQNSVPYVVNQKLVRGLDYYSLTVFEWVTDKAHAQNAICAGGRYDDLVTLLGGKPTPAIGFAMGLERIIELMTESATFENYPDAFLISAGNKAQSTSFVVAEQLRDNLPRLKLLSNCGHGDFKTQFRRADKSNAKLALIYGDDEASSQSLTIKFLREDKPQITLSFAEALEFLRNYSV